MPPTLIKLADAVAINFGPGTDDPIGIGEVNKVYLIVISCADEKTTTTGQFKLTITDVPVVANAKTETIVIANGQVYTYVIPDNMFSDNEDLVYAAS